MGGSSSRIQSITQTVTDISMAVMAKNSASGSSVVNQSNELTIVATGSTIQGSLQENAAKVDLAVISRMTLDGSLQAQLVSAISHSLKTDQNVIGVGVSDSDIQTITTNRVNASINVQNISSLASAVNQKNTATLILTDSKAIDAVKQQNSASAVLKLVNDMATNIAQDVSAKIDEKSSAVSSQTNPVSSFLSSPGFIVFVIVLAIAAVVGFYLYSQNPTDPRLAALSAVKQKANV